MADKTQYTQRGQMMTGFRTENEQRFYGHWSNPEYAEMLQSEDNVPCPGTCQRCGEKWEDDFWLNDEKTICLNCETPTNDDSLPY